MKNVAELQHDVELLHEQLAQRGALVDSLKEQVRVFLARRFSASSEKYHPIKSIYLMRLKALTKTLKTKQLMTKLLPFNRISVHVNLG
jgi:transposase